MMAVDILRDLKLTSETNLNLVVAPERNSPFGITMYHVGTINVLPKSFYGGKKPSTLLFTFLLLLSVSWKLAQFALRRINVMFVLIKYPKNVSSRCRLCCTEWSQSDTNTCRVKSDACFCCLQVSGGENAKKKTKKKTGLCVHKCCWRVLHLYRTLQPEHMKNTSALVIKKNISLLISPVHTAALKHVTLNVRLFQKFLLCVFYVHLNGEYNTYKKHFEEPLTLRCH